MPRGGNRGPEADGGRPHVNHPMGPLAQEIRVAPDHHAPRRASGRLFGVFATWPPAQHKETNHGQIET